MRTMTGDEQPLSTKGLFQWSKCKSAAVDFHLGLEEPLKLSKLAVEGPLLQAPQLECKARTQLLQACHDSRRLLFLPRIPLLSLLKDVAVMPAQQAPGQYTGWQTGAADALKQVPGGFSPSGSSSSCHDYSCIEHIAWYVMGKAEHLSRCGAYKSRKDQCQSSHMLQACCQVVRMPWHGLQAATDTHNGAHVHAHALQTSATPCKP